MKCLAANLFQDRASSVHTDAVATIASDLSSLLPYSTIGMGP